MAFEVKVFREITAYQPKVLFGLTWRQVAVTLVALPVLVGSYLLCLWLGKDDLGVTVVCVLAIPAVAVGWARPMGIKFEKYVGYWWRFFTSHRPYIFAQGKHCDETPQKGRKSRKTQQKTTEFEARQDS